MNRTIWKLSIQKPVDVLTVKQRSLLFFQVTKGIENAYRERDFPKIKELFEISKTNRLHLTKDSYILILQSMNKSINSCFSTYQYMKKDRLIPDEKLIIILLTNCANGADKGADYSGRAITILFDETERWNIPRTTIMFNLALKSCLLHMEMDKVVKIYEFMQEQSIPADHFTYTLLFKVFAHFGNSEKCLNLLERMKKEGIQPDIFTFNTILSSCKNDESDRILSTFREMIEKYAVHPSVHTFSIILSWIRNHKQFHRAKDLYKEMIAQQVDGDEMLLNSLAIVLSLGGNSAESLDCLKTLKNKSLRIEPRTFQSLLTTIRDQNHLAQLKNYIKDAGLVRILNE